MHENLHQNPSDRSTRLPSLTLERKIDLNPEFKSDKYHPTADKKTLRRLDVTISFIVLIIEDRSSTVLCANRTTRREGAITRSNESPT
jgi:hypothetical protein